MTISLSKLKEYWDIMKQFYLPEQRKMRLLDATDNADLWKALAAKFPSYQILPDTNYVAYVKNNLLASIYTVTKSADIMPTSEKDKELIVNLNIALNRIWSLARVGYYQFQAGERAALLNVGYTQVGWDDSVTAGSGDSFYKGNVTLKNISPLKFMRDPFAPDLDSSGYCCTFDTYHKSVFLENSNYKEKFLEYEEKRKGATPELTPADYGNPVPKGNAKDYYTLITYWVKDNDAEGNVIIGEYHTINNEEILYQKESIKPGMFPIAELYCNLPAEKLVGVSEPAKIFANNVAINLMDSIALTSEYKNQRPPKFISSASGLNIQAFNKHANDADHTFIVNGRADQAVHYQQFPQPSAALPSIKMSLEKGLEQVSGVDGRYTGRDTGSIITTGGTEEMLNRVTLIDTPKVMNYENYTKRLTQLILANFVEYAPKRKYFYKKPNTTKWDSIEVNFPQIDSKTLFDYEIDISSQLPKNRARVAATANMLMEKQMQYNQEGGGGVQLITEEEWLMFQDLPMKEFMLERMGVQRMQDAVEDVSQVLFGYADLVKKGMKPDDALLATANVLDRKRKGMLPDPNQEPIAPVQQDMMMSGMPQM
jgi:hypothetical protein